MKKSQNVLTYYLKKVIYPGSFDPFTKGHKDILKRAGEKSEQVIVGVGQNPDKKYMFSFNKF